MKRPDRRASDLRGQRRVRIGRSDDARHVRRRIARERIVGTARHLAADRDDRGPLAIVPGHVPRAGAAHRDAGQIDAARIAVKLADRRLQLRHRHRLRLAVPLVSEIGLRKNDDRLVSLAVALQRRREADADLPHIVRAAFAAAVQIEHDRPVMQLRVVVRQPDAVLVGVIAELDLALQKLRAACAGEQCTAGDCQRSEKDDEASPRGHLLEQIVLGDRERLLLDVRTPHFEDVEIPVQQENLPGHLPPCRQPRADAALVLLDQMPEVVDDRLLLPVAGARAEKVERCLDLEAFLIAERHRLPHRAAHHANARQHRTDLHLQMKEVADRPAAADADVHVALVAHHRPDERLDVLVGDIEHVAVDEKEDIVSRVVDAEAHRVALAAILAQGDRGDVERARDLNGTVGGPSLTTMISSIIPLFVSAVRTSAIVFSSLYAAMMAEIPNERLLSSPVGVQPADHTTAICRFLARAMRTGQTFAQAAVCHETEPHFRDAADRGLHHPLGGHADAFGMPVAGRPEHRQSALCAARRRAARRHRAASLAIGHRSRLQHRGRQSQSRRPASRLARLRSRRQRHAGPDQRPRRTGRPHSGARSRRRPPAHARRLREPQDALPPGRRHGAGQPRAPTRSTATRTTRRRSARCGSR